MTHATGLPEGAPPRFANAEEAAQLIAGYFAKWDNLPPDDPQAKKAPNVFGICLHCEMSYDCFCDYENGDHDKRDPKFSQTFKMAKVKLLDYNAQHALTHTAGAVFNTVNLSRKVKEPWRNTQVSELTGPNGGKIQVEGFAIKFVDPPKPSDAG